MNERQILEVSQVNEYIKTILDRDGILASLCIRGEISNYKMYPSGHHYFSLKDAGGAIRCVMFKSSAVRLRFRPENGMRVLALGRVTAYPRDGAYQLYCTALSPEGVGDLYVAFEQLKTKLQQEGLFDLERKKPLPQYPQRIAVITSAAGAAIHDMLRILGKRYPLSKVLLLPVRVQGAGAGAEIAGAISYANRHQVADLIITGRGGGSMEDLWAFNEEIVARAIGASKIPVISAVGHEPDVTISDFAADLRAATPSNAAELAVPDQMELRQRLGAMESAMAGSLNRRLKLARQRLHDLSRERVYQGFERCLHDRRLWLDAGQKHMLAVMERTLAEKKQTFVQLTAGLDAMSPLKVLSRGYSVTWDSRGDLLTDASVLRPGDRVHTALQRGSFDAIVETVQGGLE